MSDNLKGYTALVTGGSSGLGFEMAKQLLSQGATVIISARGRQRLEDAKERLSSVGDVRALSMDITSEESVARAYEWVNENFGRLDMLVCNAGIGRNAPGMDELPAGYKFYDIPLFTVKAVVDTNFLGFFIVASKFIPMMVKQGSGRVLYVSTSTSTMTREGQIPYGPSKAGAEAMAAVMAKDLKGTGVTVNVITPGGFTDTPMAGKGDLERYRKIGKEILKPDVLNKTISFLASPASKGINGEKIVGKEIDEWLMQHNIEFEL